MKSCLGTGFWAVVAFIALVFFANKASGAGTVIIFILMVIGIPLVLAFLIVRRLFFR